MLALSWWIVNWIRALTFAISAVFHLIYTKPQPTLKEPLKTNIKTNHPTLKDPSMILNELTTKKLLTHKPACHIRLLPIRLHIDMWVVYLHMFHADIQLKAYTLSNFHQTSHQSTYKNYQTMNFRASFALCHMIKLVITQTLEIIKQWNQVALSMDLTWLERFSDFPFRFTAALD